MPAEIWTLGNDRRESERSRIKKSHRSLHRSPPSGNQQASRGWGGTSSSEGRCREGVQGRASVLELSESHMIMCFSMLFRLLFISVTVCVVRWCVPCLNREMNAIDRESGYSNYRQCSAVCLQLCSCSFETWLSWSCFNSFLLCLWIWTQNSAEHFKNSIFWWLHINQRNCVFIVLFAVFRRVEKVDALAVVEVLLKSELKDVRQARAFSTESFARADRAFMLFFCGLCNLV